MLTKQCCRNLIRIQKRFFSSEIISNEQCRRSRSLLFTEEQSRQRLLVPRIEKIEVKYKGLPNDETLLMNKHLSTPFNCAQHLSEGHMKRSVVAKVNGIPWDMHRPLESSCELEFVVFEDPDPHNITLANKVFWRSCSFMLGSVVETAIKDDIPVNLHSYPSPNVRSGSFIYDCHIGIENWNPEKAEMRSFSGQMFQLANQELTFERLDVETSVALKMFAHNRFKLSQIPSIASQSKDGSTITVYRLGDHVDISRGPMMSSSRMLGKCSITGMHKISTRDGPLFRFQGVALPYGVLMNHYAYGLLEKRASTLNRSHIPSEKCITLAEEENDHPTAERAVSS